MTKEKQDIRSRIVRQRQIKERVQRHNESTAMKAQKAAKGDFLEATQTLRKAKEAYSKAQSDFKAGVIDDQTLQEAKTSLKDAQANQKITKKVKKKVRKTNPTIGQKARQTGRRMTTRAGQEFLEVGMDQDDTLSDLLRMKRQARQARVTAKQAGRATGKGARLAYRGAKGSVKIGAKGTQYAYEKARKGSLKATQASAKAASKATQVIATATKAIVSYVTPIMTNPLTWLISGVMGLLLLIIILVSSVFASNIVQQDEFTLNHSWLHISRMDRKESTDKVDYYTDIDSILLYMNYRYGGEWEPDAKWEDGRGGKLSGVLGFNHFSDALDDIWKEENKDPNNLKTMAELYTNGKEWMRFSSDDLEEYKDILESQSETGKYLAYQELANPFYSVDDEKAETEHLTVTQRYGYTDKDTINPTTTLQAASDKLYAPMDGKVTVIKTDLKGKKTKTTNVMIADKDARFIFYDVKNIRVKTEDTVETGVELGKVSGDTQQIAYAKNYGEIEDKDAKWLKEIGTKDVSYGFTEKTKQDKTNTWVLVNPGFYFPFVTYAQQTTVIQEASEMSGRAKQFYDLVKKKVKNATDNGIAAIVGCFGVESGVQPKRAEGDFLSPPVGASPSSWDDDKWLDIPGPAIYGGGYPNILRRGLGMGQFTDTTDGAIRNTLLREYAKKKGKKWYDMELQVDFMLEGDNPYYTKIFKEIATSNRDVDTLTAEFLAKWEGVPGNKLAQRQAIAYQALNWFKMDFSIGGSMSIARGAIAHIFSVPYTVVQPYGKTPWSQGGGAWMYPMGRHSGIDLQGQGFQSGNVSVHSATDGKVNTVSADPMGGYYIVIEPKLGGYIYYGHMKSASVQKGQTVKKGQQIGIMGTGGGVYHVHFEYNTNLATLGTALSQDRDPGFLIPAKGLTQNQVINPK
ncbi:CHAP domain-containing protein [Streptococcus agalactiae]|uniref:phage tail tip lysozyme n=1 Tax=Streptococcus agalactiae TaxID=1311 RepID=UPI001010524D|nr:phage tail tip lysozyme [Streptococcus agalactiae]RXN51054.1 CHAP domain-containing protein [Streptococcus agalactiae]